VAQFTKKEVLDREELKLTKTLDVKYLVIESIEQFWHGGDCFIPVRYKAKPYKRRIKIKR